MEALPLGEALFGRRVGAGAGGGPVVLKPCDQFTMLLQMPASWFGTSLVNLGVPAEILAQSFASPPSAVDALGNVTVSITGVYPKGSMPQQIFPRTFASSALITVVSASINGTDPGCSSTVVKPITLGGGGSGGGGVGGDIGSSIGAGLSKTAKVGIAVGGVAVIAAAAIGSKLAGWW